MQVTGLLTVMYKDEADFTNTFRALGSIAADSADELPERLRACLGAEPTEDREQVRLECMLVTLLPLTSSVTCIWYTRYRDGR